MPLKKPCPRFAIYFGFSFLPCSAAVHAQHMESSQKASKIEVQKNIDFFIDFCAKRRRSQKCRHAFRIGFSNTKCLSDDFLRIACCMRFGFEKPTKNLPKTYPKRGPSDEKIDVKNDMLFNIDFFAFGPRFWSLLGLQDGAKLAILAPQNVRSCPLEPS